MDKSVISDNDTFKKYQVVVHCDNRLPLMARKIFNVLISFNEANYGGNELQRIPEDEVIKRLGKSRKHINYYREQFILLGKTNFDFFGYDENNKKFYGTCSILSGAIVDEGNQEWIYSTPSKIIEWIKQRGDQITLSLSIQHALNSKYSLALYEEFLCRTNGKHSIVTLTPEEIKFITCGVDKHQEYKYLKKQVINPSIEELTECTNLNVKIHSEERKERKVYRINFSIDVKEGTEIETNLINKMNQEYGIDIGMAVRLAKEFEINQIENALLYTKQKIDEGVIVALPGRSAPNIGGFAVNAIRKGMIPSSTNILKKKENKKQDVSKLISQNEIEKQNQRSLKNYLAENTAFCDQMKQKFLKNNTDGIIKMLIEKEGFENPIVEHKFMSFVMKMKNK